ncbi:chaperone DnaJ-domain superfamily protein [Klebsormidium nitens]|uniref:Chaperone DnaJ-domain superfamily protein n=1 Tax=Klebsormidium nitens TaxID=105231 RepID=A0A1Y1I961_KLENI|nr:chaperone DnaJ-domain superfamily protein [Klebsormidium nitens]|eukprot:GAQ87470.1 chaperone DnaJ-domain superfamily protein [Klebsormidium nitens]
MQAAVRWVGSAPAIAFQHPVVSNGKSLETGNRARFCSLKSRGQFGNKVPGLSGHRMAVKGRRSSLPLSGQVRATSDMTSVKTEAQPVTFYDILGVSREASTDDIHLAYKARKKQINEKVGSDAKEPLEALEAAYDELREPESRRFYDFGLANQAVGDAPFVWPYEVDMTQRLAAETEQKFKEEADPTLFSGFDNDGLSDDEQYDLTSDLLIIGVLLSLIISAALKLGNVGLNSFQSMGETAVEMWEKLGP